MSLQQKMSQGEAETVWRTQREAEGSLLCSLEGWVSSWGADPGDFLPQELAVLHDMAMTSNTMLFKSKLIKQNLKFHFSVPVRPLYLAPQHTACPLSQKTP